MSAPLKWVAITPADGVDDALVTLAVRVGKDKNLRRLNLTTWEAEHIAVRIINALTAEVAP